MFKLAVGLQHEETEKALATAPDKRAELEGQAVRLGKEADQCSYQLAHLHEARDKALVDMSRLEEVSPLVRKEWGVNMRTVRGSMPKLSKCLDI